MIKCYDFLKEQAKALNYSLKPSLFLSDFESAAIKAFEEAFDHPTMKGCYFHFTKAIWKNISQIGLESEYQKKAFAYEWLNWFKSLAFVPFNQIQTALNLILANQPRGDKFEQFKTYFHTTWMISTKYPIQMWNHYYTEGPRTNNHVEGYNKKINTYIDNFHPHIYSAINTFKVFECTTGINYYQREAGGLTQFPRRPKDIQRNVMINYLKNKFELNQIQLCDYEPYDTVV